MQSIIDDHLLLLYPMINNRSRITVGHVNRCVGQTNCLNCLKPQHFLMKKLVATTTLFIWKTKGVSNNFPEHGGVFNTARFCFQKNKKRAVLGELVVFFLLGPKFKHECLVHVLYGCGFSFSLCDCFSFCCFSAVVF